MNWVVSFGVEVILWLWLIDEFLVVVVDLKQAVNALDGIEEE